MDNSLPIENDPLVDPLRREAELARPEFSERLHARPKAAVRAAAQTRSTHFVGTPNKLPKRRLLQAITVVASIMLIVGSMLIWRTLAGGPGEPHGDTSGPVAVGAVPIETIPQEPVKQLDDIDATTDLVGSAIDVGNWMAATIDENQWAGLDRDARSAVAAVTSPLPFDLSAALAAADNAE
jgi:hypothetical protein